ncbi:hypothetical protein ABT116_30860 [Streptomyces sp. NPDC002130]
MAAAQRLLNEHGAFLDDLENSWTPRTTSSRAPPRDPARRRILDPRGS